MTYTELEQIAVGLFGDQWQKQLADRLGVPKHSIQNWRRAGVAKWVPVELATVAMQRRAEVQAALELLG